MEQTVGITMNTWISLLEERREKIRARGWAIPDCVWDYAMEIFKEGGAPRDPRECSPWIVVDNIALNSEFHDFDECKLPDESDEDFIARVKRNAMAIFPEERIVLYSLYV